MKRTLLFCLFVLPGLTLFSFIDGSRIASPKSQKVIKTIIVDAGHGIMDNGGHNGAKGSYSYEDEICLAVSKELVAVLKDEMPEVRVVETRPADRIVALHRRAEIANENKGDLFICIHVNAAVAIRHSELTGYKTITTYSGKGKKKRKIKKRVPQYRYWTTPNPAKGAETYIWGAHKNEDKEVAMREATAMPSILVETGYITNRSEEDYLNSKKGQEEVAECVTRAVKTYVAWLERQQQTNNDNTKNKNTPVSKDVSSFLQMVEQKEKKIIRK